MEEYALDHDVLYPAAERDHLFESCSMGLKLSGGRYYALN